MFCKGVMRTQELKRCLVINRGEPFKRSEKRTLEKYFADVDFVEKNIKANLIPSKAYDLIILNWALEQLKDEGCEELLFNLRRR